MDPIAHTLVGASLAQTGLGQRVRYGAAALVIGANLPDIDSLVYFIGSDAGLYYRRGWTHGVVAIIVLPLLLAGLLSLIGHRSSSRTNTWQLVWLSCLGVLTHPLLDWLNTYGVRLLMPLEPRWFYGDAVFIVDPWIWLFLGAAVFLANSMSRVARVSWILGLGIASLFVFSAVPTDLWGVKTLWLLGWAMAILMRFRLFLSETGFRRAAGVSLAVTCLYLSFMVGSTAYARQAVSHELALRGIEWEQLMVGPLPATPFVRDVVVATPTEYHYGRLDMFPALELHLEPRTIPIRPSPSPIVEQAFRSPEIRGFTNWVRFPFVEIEDNGANFIVHIMDARYARRRGRGFGSVSVSIPK